MARKLEQILKDNARYWGQQYTILAKAKAPKHIAPYISTTSKVTEGRVELLSTVKPIDMRGAEGQIANRGTLDAAAQEYGHPGATIVPRTRGSLAFHWQIHPKNARYIRKSKIASDNGKILLQKVDKKPQKAFNNDTGYMRPAMKEWTTEFMASSSKFKDAIRLDILDAFNKVTKVNLSK